MSTKTKNDAIARLGDNQEVIIDGFVYRFKDYLTQSGDTVKMLECCTVRYIGEFKVYVLVSFNVV